ncbi:M50 family metallopeptidase [Candidatus Woesearchaeota archaeon]|nr:M50 family metallopeptidase [Candidatus Woesearchaeota archaeon]
MVISLFELLDMVLMTLIIGYLFKDAFRIPLHPKKTDILDQYKKGKRFDWEDFWFACALIAPSILIHEFGHKFTALAFGLDATFHGACSVSSLATGGFFSTFCSIQLLAIVLKYIGFGFVFFIPAFVSITGSATPLQHALISFMGPFVHLVFWLGAAWILKDYKRIKKWSRKKRMFVFFFKQINMLLFILNMLPIPGFDGYWVFMNLYKAFF